MANWQYNAIQDLREYEAVRRSLESIPEEIRTIEADMQIVRGTSYDKSPVQGGGSGMEERLINYIERKERLAENYRVAAAKVKRIERGLNALSDKERLVLQRFFISRTSGHVGRLCEELGYEQAQVYRMKDAALKRFTLAMFGVVDL